MALEACAMASSRLTDVLLPAVNMLLGSALGATASGSVAVNLASWKSAVGSASCGFLGTATATRLPKATLGFFFCLVLAGGACCCASGCFWLPGCCLLGCNGWMLASRMGSSAKGALAGGANLRLMPATHNQLVSRETSQETSKTACGTSCQGYSSKD